MGLASHGVSVNFGVGTTIVGINGMFQHREHHYVVNSEPITDGGDTTVSKVYWDVRETAALTYIAVQPQTGFINASVNVPSIGSFISVVDVIYPADSTDGQYQYATGGIRGEWLVDDIVVNSSNTTCVRVSLSLSRYPHLQHV